MKEFEKFVEEGEVQERTSNPERAKSLMKKAAKRLKYVKDREITEHNADLILEDSYESIREAIDAFLVEEGYKSYSHEAAIVYAFEKLELTYDQANKLNKFRKLRNDSKYRGEEIETSEAEDVLEMAEELVPELEKNMSDRN